MPLSVYITKISFDAPIYNKLYIKLLNFKLKQNKKKEKKK